MSLLAPPTDPLRVDVRDARTGAIVRPGDTGSKAAFEGELLLELHVSRVEVALNDCLATTNDLLRTIRRMLQLPELAVPHPKHQFPKQCDVDRTCDNAFKLLRRAADTAAKNVNLVKEPDPVLHQGRLMVREYASLLRQVNPIRDSAPGIFLASEWLVCDYLLRGSRSTDAARVMALAQWQQALVAFHKMLAGGPGARP